MSDEIVGADDPAAINAAAAALLEQAAEPFPEAPNVPSDYVKLPAGLAIGDNPDTAKIIKHATVRELTGADEELLASASKSGDLFHFMNTLLECGTVQVGDEDKAKTKELLKKLLIGDRDAILLGIREATYGDHVEVYGFQCPECSVITDLIELDLDDIEVKTLDDPRDNTYTVKLRNGRVAHCKMLTGEDQIAIMSDAKLSAAQRNTIIVRKAVTHIVKDEREFSMEGYPSMALEMGLQDRKKILKEIVERQPGPKYNDIKFTHVDCGKKVSLAVGVGDLFLV